MNILVTGGAGFIGSNLVDKLVELGHNVSIIDNLSTGNLNNVNKKATLYIADIVDKSVSKIFEKENFDIVYHMAAQIDVQRSLNEPVYDAQINILGTLNILENCARHHIKKIIYSSSAAIYGNPVYLPVDEQHCANPISYYGLSKFAPEGYIKVYADLYKLDYTILRYANVYGIRQDPKGEGGVVCIFLDKMLHNDNPTVYGDGDATRDFVYVDDIVSANVSALKNGSHQIYNIGTGTFTSVNELAYIMRDAINPSLEIVHTEERKGDIKHSYFAIEKAKASLNWTCENTLTEGLTKTINYYKNLIN